MYAKCRSLNEAHRAFDQLPNRNAVSWGAMIAGHVDHGHGLCALELFQQMKEEHIQPDKVTFLCILKACGIVAVLGLGRLVHEEIIRFGLKSDLVWSSLVGMYAKSGSIQEAHDVFDTLPNRDVVTWGVIIAGYAQCGQGLPAVELFNKMQSEGIKPDKVTFLSILKACGSIGAVEQGRWIHDQTIKIGFEVDMLIGNTLVDMYGKCGSVEEAWKVFNKLPKQDLTSWGAMIAALAQYGNLRLAQQCLEDMRQQGLKPGIMIFSSILAACSQIGHLEEGWAYFRSMKEDYNISPSMEHYNCMLDLLSRSGYLYEAKYFLQSMPTQPSVEGWVALLTACMTYGNVKLGRECFDRLVQLDPEASGYVLMSNIYAGFHMWEEVDRVQELRECVGALKKPGMAWIEVSNKVHEFIVGGKSHQQNQEFFVKLRPLKEQGYVPAVNSARADVG